MLTDYQTVKEAIGVPSTDTSQDAKIQLLTSAADAVVKQYTKRNLETQAGIVEYPLLRNGAESLVLQETPVLCYRLNGNITNGSPTITGLSSVSNLLVGMPVIQAFGQNGPATQPFPNGATIQSIDTTNIAVTLTGNCSAATQSNVSFIFGLALWLDIRGNFGDGIGSDVSGPFAASTLRYLGRDYSLQRDQSDGTSMSGKLTYLSGWWGLSGAGIGGAWGWNGLSGYGWMDGGGVPLSAQPRPQYPSYPPGCVKVIYAAGYGIGATMCGQMPPNTTIPADLTAATSLLAVWMWNNADTGGMLISNESYQGYSSSIAPAIDALKTAAELGSIRQILSRYRKVAV